jgi:hypothetical protein
MTCGENGQHGGYNGHGNFTKVRNDIVEGGKDMLQSGKALFSKFSK